MGYQGVHDEERARLIDGRTGATDHGSLMGWKTLRVAMKTTGFQMMFNDSQVAGDDNR